MKLEDQLCTMEQSNRLKRLGIGNHGIIEWYYHDRHKEWKPLIKGQIGIPKSSRSTLPCFTVAELGVMLPGDYLRADIDQSMNAGFAIGVWPTNVNTNWGMRTEYGRECTFHPTEAEARAAMLIRLLENKLITASQVNASLTQQQ